MTMAAAGIVRKFGKMINAPSYYSGRGALHGDCGVKNLEGIYRGIKKEVGVDAAKAFANQVAVQEDMSATAILHMLFDLEGRNWELAQPVKKDEGAEMARAIQDTERKQGTEAARAVGMLGIATMFGSSNSVESEMTGYSIRTEFLMNHRDELTVEPCGPVFSIDGIL
jgi:hypothetical protein